MSDFVELQNIDTGFGTFDGIRGRDGDFYFGVDGNKGYNIIDCTDSDWDIFKNYVSAGAIYFLKRVQEGIYNGETPDKIIDKKTCLTSCLLNIVANGESQIEQSTLYYINIIIYPTIYI